MKAIIYGAGGHAKVVADILLKNSKLELAAFVDDRKQNSNLLGHPVISEKEFFSDSSLISGVVAVGDNSVRSKIVEKILHNKASFKFLSLIHPNAVIGLESKVGEGSVVMAGAILNPSAVVGNHCIVNTRSSLDHDAELGEFASIGPGVSLGGNCHVGTFTAIGIGASVSHGVGIGKHSVIGGGAFADKDIGDFVVAFGVPCKEIRKRTEGERYL